MRNDNKGRDIFYGVVAIATLIVAIVGATLAYFSVTASSNEGAINATAAIVSIEYNDGQQVTAQADQLIPSEFEVVQKVYEKNVKDAIETDVENLQGGNLCIDSNSRQVCSAYRFSIYSEVERAITATLNNESNGFTYLSYAVYDVTKGEWLSLDDEGNNELSLNACHNNNDVNDDDCYKLEGTRKKYSEPAINSIFGYTLNGATKEAKSKTIAGATQVYDLVLFIKETNTDQNIDQGQSYTGNIVIDVLDSGLEGDRITGYVDENY